MLKLTRDSIVDFQKYEKRLRNRGHIYIDVAMLQEDKKPLLVKYKSLEEQATRILRVDSSGFCTNLGSSEHIYDYLIEHVCCPSYLLKSKTNKQGYSIDAKHLTKVLNRGLGVEFIETYIRYNSIETQISKLNKIIGTFSKPCGKFDNFGNELHQLDFDVNIQQNFRYNYNKYDVISIPKASCDTVKVPNGHIMVWGDFAQADFRIAYNLLLRDEDNQIIMDSCEDKYEGLARIVAKANNEKFDPVKFKEERNTYKVCTLATVYGASSGKSEEETILMKKISKFLEACPSYVDFKKRITDRLKMNKPLMMETYFGNPLVVPNDRGANLDPMNKALNSPIQAGTSLLVILTTNAILDKFYELGYTEEDINIYYVRHDEPIFIMKKEVMKDAWVFKDYSTIQVDDWTPLKADFYFGNAYTKPDDNLMSDYEELCIAHRGRFTKSKPTKYEGPEFNLLPKTMKLALGMSETFDGGTVVTFLDYENKVASYIKVNSQITSEVFEEIEKRFCEADTRIASRGYDGCYVKSRDFEKETFYVKMFYRYRQKVDKTVALAESLAEYMAVSYAKREGKEINPSDRCMAYYEHMQEIKTVDLFGEN